MIPIYVICVSRCSRIAAVSQGSVTLAVLMAICFRYFLLPLAHMSTVEEAGVFGAFVWLSAFLRTSHPHTHIYFPLFYCHFIGFD